MSQVPPGPPPPPPAPPPRRHLRAVPEPEVRWLDDRQQQAWRALLLGSRLLLGRLDDELAHDHGLSLSEYDVLVRLSESGGRRRMAQLADALAHSRSRVTHTVARMERAGLVRREPIAEDGRGVDAVLTPEGVARLQEVAPHHVTGVREHLVDLVAPEDLEALHRVMDAVCDHLIAGHPEMELRSDLPAPDEV